MQRKENKQVYEKSKINAAKKGKIRRSLHLKEVKS